MSAQSQKKLNSHELLIANTPQPAKPISVWRFILPLLIQAGIIIAVPASAIHTYLTGETIILQTLPIDPYDLVHGYSVTLNYDISSVNNLKQLPGWDELVKRHPGSNQNFAPLAEGTSVYIILQPKLHSTNLMLWKQVAVSSGYPSSLAADQVVLKGRYKDGFVSYNLETYYIPEEQISEVNKNLSRQQQGVVGVKQPIAIEAKVDHEGKAIPISIWVGDRNYRF